MRKPQELMKMILQKNVRESGLPCQKKIKMDWVEKKKPVSVSKIWVLKSFFLSGSSRKKSRFRISRSLPITFEKTLRGLDFIKGLEYLREPYFQFKKIKKKPQTSFIV